MSDFTEFYDEKTKLKEEEGMNPGVKAIVDLGMPSSRAYSLHEAMEALHKALSGLDLSNLAKIKEIGLEGLLEAWIASQPGNRSFFGKGEE